MFCFRTIISISTQIEKKGNNNIDLPILFHLISMTHSFILHFNYYKYKQSESEKMKNVRNKIFTITETIQEIHSLLEVISKNITI